MRDFHAPDDAGLCCTALPAYVCPALRRRLVGRRLLASSWVKIRYGSPGF